MVEVPRDDLDRLLAGPIPTSDVDESAITALEASGANIRVEDGEYGLDGLVYGGAAVGARLDAPYRIEYFDSVDSTNHVARSRAEDGARDLVVIAGTQTGGKGRRHRVWQSPRGGVWLSIVVHPTLPPEQTGLLTFAAAVAVVDAVESVGGEAGIKWPNDVLDPRTGRKLGGVLTETGYSDRGDRFAVVGIGVNAAIPVTALPDDARSVQATVPDVDPTEIAVDVIDVFADLAGNPSTIRRRWRDHATTLGQPVTVTTATSSITGTATAVTDTGALRVETETGVETVTVGDCEHLRGVDDQ